MTLVRTSFSKVTYTARKMVKVPFQVARKPLQKTFVHIIDPYYDRHPDGRVKTREDVFMELKAQAEAWLNAKE
jgi:hypothetical protein